ncbi:uncharacterized protein [Diabrotica undecimpunctata]|uniref:uncharacterized protein n=1 Tax=Diabrotica undecimpunctata TaxID=50387 RepID=UPI003B63FE2E
MYRAMKHLGITKKLIRLGKITLNNSTCDLIAWQGHISDQFTVAKDLRQGDPLSTTMFNLVLETCLAYADDLTILAKTEKELRRVVKKIIEESQKFGLELNEDKTKYMIMGGTEGKKEDFSVRSVSVTYAGETWTLNKKQEDTLERWERKILRRIFGGQKIEDGWERRTNNELMALYKEPTITKFIKSQRIRWLGHVERMAANRMPKLVITRKLIGPKRRGRPRTRWISKGRP